MALYRKWRPQTFAEVVGQEHVVRTLRNALASGRVHHAYLFTGPRGTGKTTTARLLAKAVNCLADEPSDRPCNHCAICAAINEGRLMDLIEIDAASNTGVDDVRELRERVGYRPSEARYKVYVVDEVHMLSTAAFNALLKTLEEPPPHVIFVLATTEPHKIPATILSRCQRLDFRRVPLADIVARLRHMAQQESIRADDPALELVARQATGSMRDAESLLDQLAAYSDGGITVEVVQAALGTGEEQTVLALADALAAGDVGQGLALINTALERGADPRQLARQTVEHLRGLLLTRLGAASALLHLPDGLREQCQAQADRFTARQLARAVRLFNQAAVEARAAWQPQLPLELAFVEATLPPEEAPPSPPRPASVPPRADAAPPPAASPRSTPAQQSAPSQPTPPAQDAPRPGNGPALDDVQQRWSEFLGIIRPRNLSLEALLRSGQPVNVEGNVVFIGFTHQFHKGKVEEESNRRLLENSLGQMFGQPLQVRCVVARVDPAPSPDPATEDGLVRAAVQKLGARVAKRSPTPNQEET